MGDLDRRQLERAAGSGDAAAATRLLAHRVRVGDLLAERLELAAALGDEAACAAVGSMPPTRDALDLAAFGRFDHEARTRVAHAIATHAVHFEPCVGIGAHPILRTFLDGPTAHSRNRLAHATSELRAAMGILSNFRYRYPRTTGLAVLAAARSALSPEFPLVASSIAAHLSDLRVVVASEVVPWALGHGRRGMPWPEAGDPDLALPAEAHQPLEERGFLVVAPMGMGHRGRIVWAFDRQARAMVEVLEYAPRPRDRLRLEEIQATVHPGLAPISGAGSLPDGRAFIALAHVSGRALDGEAGPPLPLDELLRVGGHLCLALGVAHERGLFHGRLLPDHLIFPGGSALPVVRLLGVGRIFSGCTSFNDEDDAESDPDPVPTASTFRSMNPEWIKGSRADLGPASDVHSLGCILYRLATGTPAFPGDAPLKVVRAVLTGAIRPPSELVATLPTWLDRVLGRALAPRPGDRYPTALALRAALLGE